ncbi:hypothetical protein NQ318_002865 [Aromia moschata]|uniref:DDE-1 domain-containing protein n=1 Tax=Aromia moschata TaxID=1265417 RepID=A0AAV8X3F2_9CUCU|nr:hypothetical protein NQ318_002865 [Aromia moschata]
MTRLMFRMILVPRRLWFQEEPNAWRGFSNIPKLRLALWHVETLQEIYYPPVVVYKAANLYAGWTQGGPPGTVYSHTLSGWFDMDQFEKWFFEILLPKIKEIDNPDKKIVVGDNLASHFSPTVIEACEENNIYMTALPPNSTHLMQPLDVAEVLKRIPDDPPESANENAQEMMSESLIELLKDLRGSNKEKATRKRGKKIDPGKQIKVDASNQKEPSSEQSQIEEPVAGPSGDPEINY